MTPQHLAILIAIAFAVLIFMVIYLGVSWGFAEYEKRKLDEQINSQFYMNLGINESIRKECEFLEGLIRPYEKLAHKYSCSDAEELEKLIMDLHDKLFEKKEK